MCISNYITSSVFMSLTLPVVEVTEITILTSVIGRDTDPVLVIMLALSRKGLLLLLQEPRVDIRNA
jgi:hypothetical protein